MSDKHSQKYLQGMKTRRCVLGDAHVDRAEAAATSFDAPFQQMITEAAWGHVWSGPGLTQRERSIVTIALLAALGHDNELAMHVRASVNTGASQEDLREAMMHVAIYAGVPAANHAISIVKKTFAEMDGPATRDKMDAPASRDAKAPASKAATGTVPKDVAATALKDANEAAPKDAQGDE